MTTRTYQAVHAPGQLKAKLLRELPADMTQARTAREIAEAADLNKTVVRVRLSQLAKAGEIGTRVDGFEEDAGIVRRYYRLAMVLLLALGGCGREATAPAFACTPVAVSAADSIPAALIPQVVVCVEAK